MRCRMLAPATAFVCVACTSARPSPPADAPPAASSAPQSIRVPPDVAAAARIKVEPVRLERLAAVLEVPGEVAADPDRLASIASPVAGRLESVAFTPGATVHKGDLLATARVPDLSRARAESTAKRAQAKAARANAERQRELYQAHAGSEKDMVNAVAEADTLEAQARAAEGVLSTLGTGADLDITNSRLTLRAPISGRVIARNAVVGQPLTAAEVIGTIADLDHVWFQARLYERDLGRAHLGQPVEVRLNAHPAQVFDGTISYIDQRVDPAARTVTARVVLRNRDDLLRIGLFGTARLIGDDQERQPTVVVPRAAVTDLDGRAVVFVRRADGSFERRDVVAGESAGERVAITAGLRAGEPVVVDGATTLRSIVLRGTIEAE
jgi:cobalt-zinc-cadmium efflux system membrane fusion protein